MCIQIDKSVERKEAVIWCEEVRNLVIYDFVTSGVGVNYDNVVICE